MCLCLSPLSCDARGSPVGHPHAVRRGFLLEGGAESVAECPLHRDSGGGVGAEGRGGSQATCPKWHGLISPSHWGSFVPVGPDNPRRIWSSSSFRLPIPELINPSHWGSFILVGSDHLAKFCLLVLSNSCPYPLATSSISLDLLYHSQQHFLCCFGMSLEHQGPIPPSMVSSLPVILLWK